MKSLILTADEARALVEGECEIRRKVLPEPSFIPGEPGVGIPDGYLVNQDECGHDIILNDDEMVDWLPDYVRSPYAPGETRWCQEECAICHATMDGEPLADPPVVYLADVACYHGTLYPDHRPARTMPRWASRMNARCTSVQVRQDDQGRWCWVVKWRKV